MKSRSASIINGTPHSRDTARKRKCGNCRSKTLSVGLESLCLGRTNQFTKVDATPRPATSNVAGIELGFGQEFDRRLTDSRVGKFSTWLVLLLLTGAAVLLH